MKARILLIAALFLAACQPVDDIITVPDDVTPSDGKMTLTIQATKGDAGTKALSLEGTTLSTFWDGTEPVAVYKEGATSKLVSLTVTPDASDNKHATLSGAISSSDVAEGNTLTLLIPQETWNYTGQNGTLTGDGSVAKKYDYATATVTVNPISGGEVTTTAAHFQNEQSIYRFTFSDNVSNITDFTITSAKNGLVRQVAWGGEAEEKGSITVNPTGAGPYYVALRNTSTEADTYSFTTTGTVNGKINALLLGSKNIPVAALANGKYLTATINVSQPDFSPASGEISSSSAVL